MAENDALLTTRQRRFLVALLGSRSVREACQVARVSERVGFRYLADPAVRAALAQRQAGMLSQAAGHLVADMTAARGVLVAIMEDTAMPPAQRVSAARGLLDMGLRVFELVSLAERVAELEGQLEQGEGA